MRTRKRDPLCTFTLGSADALYSLIETAKANEIVVDAYGPDECAMGWYNHFEGKLRFPIEAIADWHYWLATGNRF